MKSILLLRHAKSSRGTSGDDLDRSLARRGKKDASRLGLFIKAAKVRPNYIVSSPAKRAQQTAELLSKAAGIDPASIKLNEDLYYGGARDYLSAVQASPEKASIILLVGHNPLLEEMVSLLCSSEGSYTARISPGTLACIEHPAIEWKQIKPGTARIKWMVTPKLLKEMKF